MKLHLKLISLLLACLLLASAWGCAMPGIGDESGEKTSDSAASTAAPGSDTDLATFEETREPEAPVETETETETQTAPFETEAEPETETAPNITTYAPETTTDPHALPSLDFDGETIKILYASDAARNEFNSDVSGDIIDDSVFVRNLRIAEQLDIKFEWTGQKAISSNASSFVDYAVNMAAAGEPFDIYCSNRRAMAELLTVGMLRDISKIENSHIDLSAPHYPPLLKETCSVGDSVFFVTGDISVNALLQMQCIYYNVGLAESLGFKDLTDKVREGTWTLDALIEMSKGLYIDNDNSGTPSPADSFGFCAKYLNLDAFYTGSALKFLEPDTSGAGLLMLSGDIRSQSAIDLADKLCVFLNSPDSFVYTTTSSIDFDLPFIEEQALFCQNIFGMGDGSYDNGAFAKGGFEYGILPIPKFSIDQAEYLTSLSNTAIFWAIAWSSVKDEACSAVIEAMAYEGCSLLAPAVFENVMKLRYSPDQTSSSAAQEMYDLLRCSICVDLGKFYAEELQDISSLFGKSVTTPTSTWYSNISRFWNLLESQKIDKINRVIEATINNQ